MEQISNKIAVVGLGYVGLPLAVAFAKKYPVIGYDISKKRINDLRNLNDVTQEVESELLKSVTCEKMPIFNGFYPSDESEILSTCNIFIVTVPTPTDKFNRPLLTPMIMATKTISKYLKKGDIVIYESTVYPGVTEDEMAPILESQSGLVYNKDFYCGYSPERINPGDKEHSITKILKITSGSTPEIANKIDLLYKSIITAGTHKAPSIRVAEAAKVIENAQRDINIAFINELSKIFNLIGVDTHDVLEAASTKWNFLNFKPGLVGGHCIGVDPYYLAQKAQEVGYHPEIILAGRRLNDSMGKYVATEVVKLMIRKELKIFDADVLLLGFTFKEDCPDVRNTRVIDIYNELKNFGIKIDIFDPIANKNDVEVEYSVFLNENIPTDKVYSAVILAVAHKEFKSIDLRHLVGDNGIVYDVKGVISKKIIDARL